MSQFVLAQLNIAKIFYPLDAIQMEGFTGNLDRINSLAEQSEGFVWRLKSDSPDAALGTKYFDEDIIVNLSTWESIDHLHHFAYQTAHTEVLRRRKEWFSELKTYSVLWWQAAEDNPSVKTARKKLQLIDDNGPTEDAFTFKKAWPKPTS